jgi:hypothetical protein
MHVGMTRSAPMVKARSLTVVHVDTGVVMVGVDAAVPVVPVRQAALVVALAVCAGSRRM